MAQTVNWKRNLWAVWLSQFLSLAGFGMCGPFIPLFIKDTLHITDDAERGACVAASQMPWPRPPKAPVSNKYI